MKTGEHERMWPRVTSLAVVMFCYFSCVCGFLRGYGNETNWRTRTDVAARDLAGCYCDVLLFFMRVWIIARVQTLGTSPRCRGTQFPGAPLQRSRTAGRCLGLGVGWFFRGCQCPNECMSSLFPPVPRTCTIRLELTACDEPNKT